jgi:small-conductance mechanosensitive channel
MIINLRNTQIRTFEGNDVYVHNSKMINNTLVNVTATGLTRRDFTIGIDYRDDIGKAIEMIAHDIQQIKGVLTNPGPFVNVDNFTNTKKPPLR